ncbi:MAG: DUF2066 domain-containing protein [Methylobacter sp.]
MNVLFRALIIWALFFCQQAFAAEVQGLYETEVIAKSQSAGERDIAIKEALTIVLSRILAGSNILQHPAVQTALADASHYVRQYQYSLMESGSDANSSARAMRVLFDEPSLLNLVKTGRLQMWHETRPETLLWLVVEENGQRSFFKADMMPELDSALHRMSRQTGLPLLFPLLDLDEQRELSVSDVLSAYPHSLLAVSERYGVVSILAGRVVKMQGCWKADWAFYFDETIEQWLKPCATLNEVILTGMQGVYDRLSKYYAVKPYTLDPGSVTLKVSGIRDMKDANRVTGYLKSLAMVKSAIWIGEKAGLNLYKVNFAGKQGAFEEVVGIGRVLNPQGKGNTWNNELNYQLLPQRFN